ncbi:MAG: 50S ribosomal protein L10 [Fimbriimonadaceae bacterium]|nr:50S ribosomal protein L10 [Chthonomonadaceae bacterium]MCO5295947.1 50S ribosomal protein L10 [Fimbriimonadaceae bacterium]
MPTAEKARTIETAKGWYSKSVGLVFTDYRGLKVREMQELRRNLTAKGGELHVLKNTLFRVAVGEDLAKLPEELHSGPTAVAFVFENESECAKALFDYAKTNKNLKIKGGYFNGQSFDAKGVEALSKLPPRDVLIAQVIGTIAAPLSNLVGVIEALYADPIRTIGAVADKVAEGAPPAEAKAEAPAAAPEASAEEAPAAPEASAPEATAEEAPSDDTPAAEAAPTAEAEATPAEQTEEAAPAAEENQE